MGKNRKRKGAGSTLGEQNGTFDYDTLEKQNNDAINKAMVEENFQNIELEALEYEANEGHFRITSTDSSSDSNTFILTNPTKDYQRVTVDRSSNRLLLMNREEGNSGLGDMLQKIDEHLGQTTRNISIVMDPYNDASGFISRNGPDIVINSAYVDGLSSTEVKEMMDEIFETYS